MPRQQPIAIIGVSALFPGSSDAGGFWRDIVAGRDRITEVPPTHWRIEDYYDPDPSAPDKTYARRGGFLDPVDFDPLEFGLPPSTLPATDTSQLLALIVARQVLEDAARERLGQIDRSRISVILGVTSAQELLFSLVSRLQRPVWERALREAGIVESKVIEICERIAAGYVPWQEASFPGLLGNVVAGRIANRLDLGGTNCVTDAACASSFSAVAMAVAELELGHSDLVITGGVDTLNDIFMYLCFSKTPALSPSGDCRPFSDQADGTLLGEGLGMVALKRLRDAERDGDRIYAVLRGVGTASDGRAKSVYAPVSAGQARALTRAYAQAGYEPRSVELMEAHGTGTKAGDVAEFEGLKLAFDAPGAPRQWCALGSVKSQIGHTKAAAGAAGLFKVVMALHHRVLPPTIKVQAPNPKLEIESSPFYLNTAARPWVRGSDHPRRASVSAFGFGGSNFHLTLEEYRGPGRRAERLPMQPAELVLLGAAHPRALRARAQALLEDRRPLGWIAADSRRDWDPSAPLRLALVVAESAQLKSRLPAALSRIEADPDRAFALPDGTSFGCGPAEGRLAVLFPGQGSQYPGMGADLAMQFEAAQAIWDASANLDFDGERLHQRVFPRPAFSEAERAEQAARLTATEWAQPALAACSAAQWAVLRALGVEADAFAGHSFGEVMALHAAGAFEFETALRIARRRGELMRDAAREPGAMLALALPVDAVRAHLGAHPSLVIANHNAPDQVVVSGPLEAIAALEAELTTQRIAARRLAVASAFHSPLVAPAAEGLADALREFEIRAALRPVYGNATAARYPEAPAALRAALAGQLAAPVRFVEMIEAMYADGVRSFVEVGAGATLTGLVTAILGPRPHLALSFDRKGRHGVESLLLGLARLAAAGLPLRPQALFADQRLPPLVKPSRMTVPVSGSNLGKPYPPADPAQWPAANPEPPAIAPGPTTPDCAAAPALAPAVDRPAPAIESPAMSHDPGISQAWLEVFAEHQRQTAEAQAAFQKALSDSHAAYLALAGQSLAGLQALLHGGHAVQPASAPPVPSIPAQPPAAPAPPPQVMAPPPASAATRPHVAAAPTQPKAAPEPEREPLPPAAPTAPSAAAAQAGRDPAGAAPLAELLLAVVAEKTGYPAQMLNLDMDLEADLGVDSIKRVEILAALEERAPQRRKPDRARLAALHTLREILDHLDGATAAPEAQSAARPPQAPATDAPPAAPLAELLLAVVAEKTGYPAQMLNLDMDLEADLGVDSIKRVEILAALEERAPQRRKPDRARLAALHTLREILDHLDGATAAPESAHAVAEPAATEPCTASHAQLGRYRVTPVLAPPSGFSMPLLASERIWVIGPQAIAETLAAELRLRKLDAVASDALPEAARACIYLGGLIHATGREQALAVNREAFTVARRLAPQLAAQGGLFVTVHDGGGAFGFEAAPEHAAWLAGLPALVKTCALEWPKAALKAIDLAQGGRDAATLARVIADELLAGGGEIEVGLCADGRRLSLACMPAEAHHDEAAIAPGDLVVVSGGARGVTAACLIEWARQARPALLLIGRSALNPEPEACIGIDDPARLKQILLDRARATGRQPTPAELKAAADRILAGREIRATLEALRALGCQAQYRAVSVEDRAALAAALDEARRRHGPVRGLIHAAGVLADKRIAEKTDAMFERVFDTKVRGLSALLEATAQDPLKLLVAFSSVSARCGNTGQADYAMANEVLARVMHEQARLRPGLRVKSLGWGPWEGGMVSAGLKARFAELGVPMLPLAEGARMFARELADASAIELVLGGEPRPEALLADGAEARVERLELVVRRDSHGYLEGHALGGEPVVPMVLAAEWLTRAARSLRPGQHVQALRGLKVLKGIRLHGFENGGDRLYIEARTLPGSAGRGLALAILGADGRPHYVAEAQMGLDPATPPEPVDSPRLSPWNGEPLYDQLLFHRQCFELIDSLDGISDEGVAATVRGVRDADWPAEAWQLDVAALDAGLQAAVVYGRRVLGSANLPTAIGELRSYAAPAGGPIRVQARRRKVAEAVSTTDILLSDSGGRPLAELIGVTNHAY